MDKRLKAILGGDVFLNTCPVRSQTMSAIKGKNNKTTELVLRMAFVRSGLSGWKLHRNTLPGHPDFVFNREHLAVFVDGCFWHYCVRCGHIPKTRSEYWEEKLKTTKARDRRNTQTLRALGYQVVRIWEHQLKSPRDIDRAIKRIRAALDFS